jgi:hypothetical protein
MTSKTENARNNRKHVDNDTNIERDHFILGVAHARAQAHAIVGSDFTI